MPTVPSVSSTYLPCIQPRLTLSFRTAVESEPPYLKVSCSGYVNGSAGNKVFCAKCSYQASSFEQLLRHADDRHSDAPKV